MDIGVITDIEILDCKEKKVLFLSNKMSENEKYTPYISVYNT